jgi:error-prone DNA polymerase
MPEKVGFSRLKLVRSDDMPPPPATPSAYVELGVSSPFSFLRGASDANELAPSALLLGYDAIGIADRNTLAGVVRMHTACTTIGVKPLIGCRLDLTDAPSLLAYPIDRDGYGRLSRLLSLGKMRAEKGECELTLQDVAEHQEGIAFIAWPSDDLDVFEAELPRLRDALTSLLHVAASWLYRGDDNARIERLDRLARKHGCTILATNDVHYHAPDRRPLQDVVTCIREKVTIATAGYLLNPNAERHLKSPAEMIRLFERWPHAISATRAFADSLHFSLDELRYEYPKETVPDGKSPQEYLEQLTWEGARQRWPDGIPDKVLNQLHYELPLIEKLDFARYFLTVHDIVAYARGLDPPILCQGRGSAANSAVCYVLGVTSIDPIEQELLF